jgi:hypothetical protein
MHIETIADYLARGGAITVCPPAGHESAATRGVIVKVIRRTRGGPGATIRAAGGNLYKLGRDEWRGAEPPAKGQAVTFQPNLGNGLRWFARFVRPVSAARDARAA